MREDNPNIDEELYHACRDGDFELVKKLVERGANINYFKNGDSKKKNCFMAACRKGHVGIVKFLIEKGVDVHATTSVADVNALHCATRSRNVEICKILVECGIDPNQANANNWRAIHFAALYGTPEIIEYFVSLGSDVNSKSDSDLTPLILAARNDKVNNVRCLLKLGADPNIQDKTGATAAMSTCKSGDLQVLKILVEEGNADITLTDENGNNALVEADRMNMVECALYCWKMGCDPISIKKTKGLGPLRWIRPRILGSKDNTTPSPRYGCSSVAIGSKVYMFGGYGLPPGFKHHNPERSLSENLDERNYAELHDMWVIDFDKLHTTRIHPTHNKEKYFMSNDRAGNKIKALEDGLTVVSTELTDENSEPTSIQANLPFTKDDGICYFEVYVENSGTKHIVTIGLTDEDFKLDKLPGWIEDTYGYHGDDGQVFHNNGHGKLWGPRFSNGDIVGCGVNFKTGEVFFTINGEWLGVAYKYVQKDKYYATVGFRNPGAVVKINFGQQPFEFDFEVPTLKWEQPRLFGSALHACAQPKMFVLDDNTIITLLDSEMTRYRVFGQFEADIRRWTLIQAKGVSPRIQGEDNVLCKDRIFSLSNVTQLFHEDETRWFLYMLDVHNQVWYQVYPIHQRSVDVFPDYETKIAELGKKLKESKSLSLVTANDKLILLGDKYSIEVDPITLDLVERPLSGCRPSVKSCTYTTLGNNVICFGGWDESRKRQDGDVTILDVNENTWYKPHVFGCVPRSRNFHTSCKVISKKMAKYLSEFDYPVDVDDELSDTFIVHAFGWNGKNFIDDFDILCLNSKWKADPLIDSLDGEEYDLIFKFPTGESIKCSKIIIASRSSYFKELLTKEHSFNGISEIMIEDVPYRFFYSMLKYLHSDITDLDISIEESRDFMKVIERYAPEHEERVSESIIITWLVTRSRMSDDLEFAFNNELWHDIVFEVDDKVIYGHKSIICQRSDYFRAMLKGGMMESGQKVVKLSNIDYNSFYVVMKFVYTNKLDYDMLEENIIGIFQLSCLYSVNRLNDTLQNILAYNLTHDNIFGLLQLSIKCDANKLKQACLKYIYKNNITPNDEVSEKLYEYVKEYIREKEFKKRLEEEERIRQMKIDEEQEEQDRIRREEEEGNY